ncbi:MAG: hypothetical protein RSB05_00890 [Clostridiales bacterium]
MEMAVNSGNFAGSSNIKDQIRKNIQRNLLDEALTLVNELNEQDPDFYYFQGWIFAEKGWTQRARDYAKIATQMNPNNNEYQMLWNRLNNDAGQTYKAQSERRGFMPQCSCCEMASCLVCSDCCCESMGGDLISCC